ncbi:MAG: metal-dependent hydrolase [Thermoguttaceae bacterium]|nr:metal-dependent hydrolase [Thermoguttaceae bacterium]
MAGYSTHLTCSTTAGIAIGVGAHCFGSVPFADSCLAAVLCSIGGILPDIDSKTSISFQRCLSIVAGFSALMLVSRLRDFPMTPESVVVIGGGAFVFTYTVIGTLIKRFTRHRGMCHSIPMALLASEIIYILSSGEEPERLFKASAMFVGVMVHLMLDEFYSVQLGGSVNTSSDSAKSKKVVYIKKSFGTAIKMIDYDNIKSTVFIYVFLALVTDFAINEPVLADKLDDREQSLVERQGKDAVNYVRLKYPVQFDLAVVDWVALNKMVLEPGSANNAKWIELQQLFDQDKQSAAEEGTDNKKGATSTANAKSPSFLEQINWSSRNADRASAVPPQQTQ